MDDPSTVRRENIKTPTREKQKKCRNLNRHAEIRTKAFCVKKLKNNLKTHQ